MNYPEPKKLLVLGLSFFLIACQKDDSKPKPVALFDVSATQAEINEDITFTNRSENATSYIWEFGDGNSSTLENPVYAYESEGVYTVKLTAMNEDLVASTTKQMEIVVPENIFPGVGFMDVALEDTWQQTVNKLPADYEIFGYILLTIGETAIYIHPVGSESMGVLLFYLSVGSNTSIKPDDVLFLIGLNENYVGKTDKNIQMGSTDTQVENAYGTPTDIDYDYNGYEYSNYGIDFYFDDNSKTIEMDIYLADAKKSTSIQHQLREELRKLQH